MTRLCFSIALLFVVAPAYSRDDLLQLMNALRVSECPQHLRSDQPFNGNSKLNQAARYVNDGRSMQEALRRADYRADQSAVIHATRGDNPAAFKRLLAKGYCATLTDPRLVEIGIATNRDEVALIFAAPFAPPAPGDATKVEREALRLVNEARAKARSCGGKRFAAVGPLTLNDTLHVAAVTHAKDMAAHGQVEHEGSDGSSPDERATR